MAFMASNKPGDIYMVSCWRAGAFVSQKAMLPLEPAFCLNSSAEFPFSTHFLSHISQVTYILSSHFRKYHWPTGCSRARAAAAWRDSACLAEAITALGRAFLHKTNALRHQDCHKQNNFTLAFHLSPPSLLSRPPTSSA